MSRETDPVRGLALRLMEDLGRDLLGEPLQARGWSFGYDRARRRLGACHPASRRITLSAARADELAEAEVEDTIRHEIAHAIDWERRGTTNHDATWKAVARACGASPSRTFKGDLAHAWEELPCWLCEKPGMRCPCPMHQREHQLGTVHFKKDEDGVWLCLNCFREHVLKGVTTKTDPRPSE